VALGLVLFYRSDLAGAEEAWWQGLPEGRRLYPRFADAGSEM
jgi:hypothetical protein